MSIRKFLIFIKKVSNLIFSSRKARQRRINTQEAYKHSGNHYIGINIIFFLRLMDGKSKNKKPEDRSRISEVRKGQT